MSAGLLGQPEPAPFRVPDARPGGAPRALRVGISTCPNDTFAFHGILTGAVALEGVGLAVELADVEECNRRLAAGELDVAKTSFALALEHAGDLWVLDAGSALGFGVGPVLLAPPPGARAPAGSSPADRPLVLCPGEHTTATLLYRLLHPGEGVLEQGVFSRILPALERGEADLGVCIHEGRFTYAEHGLRLVEDLGATWETRTGAPLPLGGIVARRALGAELAGALSDLVRRSIEHAIAHPTAALASMRRYAQESSDEVLWAHVDLYVNAWTRSLGATGRGALATLAREAGAEGELEVVGGPDALALELGRRRLYHVAPSALWRRTGERLRPPSLAREGFVHLSFADQVRGTLEAHFTGPEELVLLEVDARSVADRVLFEPSRGGALFPHLYRELRRSDVLRVHELGAPPARALPPLEDEIS